MISNQSIGEEFDGICCGYCLLRGNEVCHLAEGVDDNENAIVSTRGEAGGSANVTSADLAGTEAAGAAVEDVVFFLPERDGRSPTIARKLVLGAIPVDSRMRNCQVRELRREV
ncbi:uncharacterized protein EMH_0019580 [Eimeria mitis]|uniref:Uncharacterized protein n=1 Tax=Eimeria mitis TaxID=44415 RepID=U6K8I8_9EIME|nr:uncharacterized protein EMH_0019580 [Eimeria mitis]CDJ34274.1 hypothetical protein EMH_0019580 [Eimeria mitis]